MPNHGFASPYRGWPRLAAESRHAMQRITLPWLLAILLAGCTEPPGPVEKKAAEPPKPPEAVTGRFAFHHMYPVARAWLADVQVMQIASMNIPEVKSEAGKYGAWRARFVSESRGRAKTYTYSVVESPGNTHKGVFAGHEESYSGPGGLMRPFLIAALKVDSDAAFETAMKKGEAYAKKNPAKPISFLLELSNRFPNPAWRVIWGESVSMSNYSIYTDASTGEYLQTMR